VPGGGRHQTTREDQPQLIVGAGTVLNIETARACLDAGAAFVTSPGLDRVFSNSREAERRSHPRCSDADRDHDRLHAGADLIKIFPCSAVGGPPISKR